MLRIPPVADILPVLEAKSYTKIDIYDHVQMVLGFLLSYFSEDNQTESEFPLFTDLEAPVEPTFPSPGPSRNGTVWI